MDLKKLSDILVGLGFGGLIVSIVWFFIAFGKVPGGNELFNCFYSHPIGCQLRNTSYHPAALWLSLLGVLAGSVVGSTIKKDENASSETPTVGWRVKVFGGIAVVIILGIFFR